MFDPEFIGPIAVSNVISAALILTAVKWPCAARTLFVLLFLSAGAFNLYTALTGPEAYLSYAKNALECYRDFIEGFFRQHTQAVVVMIALGQLVVSVLLTRRGRWFSLGVLGGLLFLLAIVPLGAGSAFPAPILMAGGLVALHRRRARM